MTCEILLYLATGSGKVLCYILWCLSVCTSICPSNFWPITKVFLHEFHFYSLYISIGNERYGIVNEWNLLINDIRVMAFFSFESWFLALSSFTSGTIWMKLHGYIKDQRLHTMQKSHNSGCFCTRVICPWLFCKIHFACFRQIISESDIHACIVYSWIDIV